MGVQQSRRAVQALAIAAVGVPCALLAHLLATGGPAPALAAVLATCAILVVAAAIPARSSAALALVTAATQLAAQSVLAGVPASMPGRSPACLPAVGRAATLGLHLAVLHQDHGCPHGQLALTTTAAAALSALLAAAAILIGNTLVAVITGMMLGRTLAAGEFLLSLVDVLGDLLARSAALLCWALPPLVTGPPARRGRDDAPGPPAALDRVTAVTRRGPPVLLAPAY